MDNLQAVREATCRESQLLPDTEAAVQETRRAAPGPMGAPEVGVLVYRPEGVSGPLPCILHMHGGGFVFGAPHADRRQHRTLAAELACCVVSVDYRLAPETPFPGAIDDCYAVLTWLNDNAKSLGVDASRIGVMGESAGGGLAACLALLARDRAEFGVAFQHLIYPMLDDRTGLVREPHALAGEFIWTAHNNQFGWRALLGGGEASPYAAAARAGTLAGLPPTYIATGALDLLADETLAYARRLIASDVAVELRVYPGAFHAFDYDAGAQVSARARQDSRSALRRALYPAKHSRLSI